jgi:hypothetical protein
MTRPAMGLLHNKHLYVACIGAWGGLQQATSVCMLCLTKEMHLTGDNPVMTFSSAQVCRATGLSRGTFDAWMQRRYMPLGDGPGTGRTRMFSILDTVRLAVVGELTRLGISVGIAGRLVGNIQDRHLELFNGERWAMLLASSFAAGEQAAERAPGFALVHFENAAAIQGKLPGIVTGKPIASFAMVDVTAVVDRTRAALNKG